MSKVNPDNYIVIQGWMLSDLKLKGTELLVYAIIYGFSQAEEQCYTGSLTYLSEWTNTTKMTVMTALKNLTEKGAIEKKEDLKNGVKFCRYRANNLSGMQKTLPGMQISLPGGMQNSLPGMQKTLPNNIDDNKEVENIEIIKKEGVEPLPVSRVAELYNQICVSYPQVRSLSEARKKAIKARLRVYSLDDIKTVFEKAEASDFLRGGNSRNWSASFDWLIKDANMAKVLDGNYDNKSSGFSAPEGNADIYNRGLREWAENA